VCVCGNSSEPISLRLRPIQIGSMDVKIIAINPINLSIENISSDCADSKSLTFTQQTAIRQLTVSQKGIVSKQDNSHVRCNNKEEQTQNHEIHNLSHLRDSSDIIVTNELLEPMLRFIKWKVSTANHNAMDSLSAFAASYYLYSYSNNITFQWDHKNELTNELTKSFQSLITYRHNDGSIL